MERGGGRELTTAGASADHYGPNCVKTAHITTEDGHIKKVMCILTFDLIVSLVKTEKIAKKLSHLSAS